MTIIIRDLPTDLLRVRSGSFQLLPFGQTAVGTFSPVARGAGAQFLFWRAKLEILGFTNNDEDLLGRWRVFLARLQGTYAAFPLFDPTRPLPLGAGAGVSQLEGYGDELLFSDPQGRPYSFARDLKVYPGATHCRVGENQARGHSNVLLTGLVPSSECFKTGDYLSIGRNLHHVITDARSDANGASRVSIEPPLWNGVVTNDLVQLGKPTGLFMLTDPQSGAMQHGLSGVSNASIEAVSIPWKA